MSQRKPRKPSSQKKTTSQDKKGRTNARTKRETNKRTKPRKADRRLRRMFVPTSLGNVPATIHGSKEASQLGRYLATVGNFLRTGKTEALSEFEGLVIAKHTLITDPELLSALAQANALQIEDIYVTSETS
jgi:hypothetical protein